MGWIGGPLKVRTHPLPPPSLACVIQDLKVVALQRTVVSRFECFVFEVRVLCFRVLGAPFSRFGCFVFEIWVLRFRDLGASFSRFGCFVLRSSFSSASLSKLPTFMCQLCDCTSHADWLFTNINSNLDV